MLVVVQEEDMDNRVALDNLEEQVLLVEQDKQERQDKQVQQEIQELLVVLVEIMDKMVKQLHLELLEEEQQQLMDNLVSIM